MGAVRPFGGLVCVCGSEKEEGGSRPPSRFQSACVRGDLLIDRAREIVRGLTMVLPAELGDALLEGFFSESRRWENRFQSGLLYVFDTN